MLTALYSGISGLQAHQARLDVVANNIANVNTTAFKASRVTFSDLLSQTTSIATAPQANSGGQNPQQVGLGVSGVTITKDMSQGSIDHTDETTDLAISGGGFFVMRDGEAIAQYYTRDGSFTFDSAGNLVSKTTGYRVQGWNSYYDTLSQSWTINSSNPVEDIELDLDTQMAANATTKLEWGGNLDNRLDTQIEPIQVEWSKNGVTREVEMRFEHCHPTEPYYKWSVYDPSIIDATTGDYKKITSDSEGLPCEGIIKVDEEGKVIANYVNTMTSSAPDVMDINYSSQIPTDADRWAVVYDQSRSYNGYDFFTLATNYDSTNGVYLPYKHEDNSSATSVTSSTSSLTITVQLSDTPLASQANQSGSAFTPTSFAAAGVWQSTVTTAGDATPANGLGMPVEYVQSITNEICDKRFNSTASAGSPNASNTFVQLDNDIIVSRNRYNPARNGQFALSATSGSVTSNTEGTDGDSLQLYIDGRQYTRVSSAANFSSATAAEFVLDPVNGIIEINGTIASGVNIVASYDTVKRAANNWQMTAATTIAGLGGVGACNLLNVTNGTVGAATRTAPDGTVIAGFDNSIYWKSGSGGSIVIGGTDTYTEVGFQRTDGTNQTAATLAENTYCVNPETGAIVFGNRATTHAQPVAADTVSGFAFSAYRRTRDNTAGGTAITGLNNVDCSEGASTGNAHGFNDQWRVMKLTTDGAETGQTLLYLQGDWAGPAGTMPTVTASTLRFLPSLTNASVNMRAEMNYESDSRVNVIIPNGLSKTPNVDPVTDLNPEAFAFKPNTTEITGHSGKNNQADSGDTAEVTFSKPDDYKYSTAVEVYDSMGNAWNVTVTYEHLSTNKWLMTAYDPTDPKGTRVAGYKVLAFDSDGNYSASSSVSYHSPTAPSTTSSTGIYFDPAQAGAAPPPEKGAGPVQITSDYTSLFQTARSNDAVVSYQNGFPAGRLESYSFNTDGYLVGMFDNGMSRELAQVALQVFTNPAGLLSVGTNMYRDTVNAGKLGSPQKPNFDGAGSITPGALEGSNVDLSVEFVDLIVTQRGFQAQSRTIQTADQVLQELLTLKR